MPDIKRRAQLLVADIRDLLAYEQADKSTWSRIERRIVGELDALPDGTVCACLDETGERKVRRYHRCERCGAFMAVDA